MYLNQQGILFTELLMYHNQRGILLQGCQCITICIEFYYRLIDTLQLVKGFITDTLQYAVH